MICVHGFLFLLFHPCFFVCLTYNFTTSSHTSVCFRNELLNQLIPSSQGLRWNFRPSFLTKQAFGFCTGSVTNGTQDPVGTKLESSFLVRIYTESFQPLHVELRPKKDQCKTKQKNECSTNCHINPDERWPWISSQKQRIFFSLCSTLHSGLSHVFLRQFIYNSNSYLIFTPQFGFAFNCTSI